MKLTKTKKIAILEFIDRFALVAGFVMIAGISLYSYLYPDISKSWSSLLFNLSYSIAGICFSAKGIWSIYTGYYITWEGWITWKGMKEKPDYVRARSRGLLFLVIGFICLFPSFTWFLAWLF